MGILARDAPAGLLLKLQQDKFTHQQTVLTEHPSYQPDYPKATGTQVQSYSELMQQGVDCIHKVLATYSRIHLLSRPDLLVKQPGQSFWRLGLRSGSDWLGKRPKLEYQIVAAFHAQVLATQGHSRIQPGYCCVEKKLMR